MNRDLVRLYEHCRLDPQWESEVISKRPLRGPQAEMIKRIEVILAKKQGGVVTVMAPRQVGKNEMAAVLHRRHLWFNQNNPSPSIWIRTAPTYKPQIVNSKKRLKTILNIDSSWRIKHPLFENQPLEREEGYIYRVGNASVEFISSGPTANVVGATASECLDMDEAHQVDKEKFDEDFAPFTASTNATTLLWGVASNGLDTLWWYREKNMADGNQHLNLYYPCDVWMEVLPKYRKHVEDRANALGWDHPIMKTQYRLLPVAEQGRFLNHSQIQSLLDSDHERQLSPRPGVRYEILVDIAAGNEDFNPNNDLTGEEETATDSTVIWIYEIGEDLAGNGYFPIVRLVNLHWLTGVALPVVEQEIKKIITFWRASKVTVDAVGVGRQIAESLAADFGAHTVNKYIASSKSASEDCFDLIARTTHAAVKMFRNDGSPEWAEFERQLGWTLYSSSNGNMKLDKPSSKQHIDMVKALTYIKQNAPTAGADELYSVESKEFHF